MEEIPKSFHTKIVKQDDVGKTTVYRGSMKKLSEVQRWLEEYGNLTHTNWIVCYELPEPERLVLHKKWICQHSNKNKILSSKRNTKCEMKIDIKIKMVNKSTKKNDSFLKHNPPLCAIITVVGEHNHTVGTAASLKYRRVDQETQKKFLSYFDSGLTPAQAMRLHTSMLIVEEDGEFKLADASQCPLERTVYYMYEKWSATHFGTIDPLSKLEEKLDGYLNIGSKIFIRKEDDIWAVLVVTPIMQRNQSESWSNELVFVDTTASCDITQVNLTVVSTATPAGAIPIGILLHATQTEECYELAFRLLNDEAPNCFGSAQCPLAFMTDDSSAEKNALKNVWPQSRQLLCNFHVAQAEWNWILQNSMKNDRQFLMNLFKQIQRADTEEKLNEALEVVDSLESKHIKYQKRILRFLKRKEEWVFLYRRDVMTRNNNTNNYSEASIRVLKDIVLERTKAFNLVALVEFTVYVWEEYFTSRLLKVAYNRNDAQTLLYNKLCAKTSGAVFDSDVGKLSETEFEMKSSSKSDHWYKINVDVGLCTCFSGRQGSFCKHQAFIHKNFGVPLPNAPPVNISGRYAMAKLALGDRCPDSSFFRDLRDTTSPHTTSPIEEAVSHDTHDAISESDLNERHEPASSSVQSSHLGQASTACTEDIKSCSSCFSSVLNLAKCQPNSKILINKLETALKTINSPSSAMNAVVYLRSSIITSRRRRGRINIQPKTPSRRREGVSRGSRPIPMGRPTKVEVLKRSIKKRERNLWKNISQSVANAKSH